MRNAVAAVQPIIQGLCEKGHYLAVDKASKVRSGVAGASNALGLPPPAQQRRLVRAKAEIASISGGSPAALERNIVCAVFALATVHVKCSAYLRRRGFYRLPVLSGQSSFLSKRFLRTIAIPILAQNRLLFVRVNRRIYAVAHIMQDVHRQQSVFAA